MGFSGKVSGAGMMSGAECDAHTEMDVLSRSIEKEDRQ